MHVKSKEIAWGGIMMALAAILIALSGVIESSSLFLLAAASFLTGMVERRISIKASILFMAGAFLVGFFIAPQKLYCFTFAGFSVYVALAEFFRKRNGGVAVWIAKGACYHILLATALVLIKYFFGFDTYGILGRLGGVTAFSFIIAAAAAEALWIIFDRAYIFFMNRYGDRLLNVGANES